MPDESLEVKLARLDEKLDFVLRDIKDLKDNTAERISKLEAMIFGDSGIGKQMELLRRIQTAQKTTLVMYGVIGGFIISLFVYHVVSTVQVMAQ